MRPCSGGIWPAREPSTRSAPGPAGRPCTSLRYVCAKKRKESAPLEDCAARVSRRAPRRALSEAVRGAGRAFPTGAAARGRHRPDAIGPERPRGPDLGVGPDLGSIWYCGSTSHVSAARSTRSHAFSRRILHGLSRPCDAHARVPLRLSGRRRPPGRTEGENDGGRHEDTMSYDGGGNADRTCRAVMRQ